MTEAFILAFLEDTLLDPLEEHCCLELSRLPCTSFGKQSVKLTSFKSAPAQKRGKSECSKLHEQNDLLKFIVTVISSEKHFLYSQMYTTA